MCEQRLPCGFEFADRIQHQGNSRRIPAAGVNVENAGNDVCVSRSSEKGLCICGSSDRSAGVVFGNRAGYWDHSNAGVAASGGIRGNGAGIYIVKHDVEFSLGSLE